MIITEYDKLDHDDPNVWELFHSGKTKGIFQLESNLGKTWSKRVKPNNIEELSALVAILRPGSLKAIMEGKSITQHYVDRKHGIEPVTYIHDSLEEILRPTLGLMLYQEQTMKIATLIAGFSGVEADYLRKAIGKKKADLMAELRIKFIAGCEKVGIVTPEKAGEIFDIIEKSARYQFNKSHSVSYAETAYWTAYSKVYQQKHFFVSYLQFAHEKQDTMLEVAELVSDCRLFGYDVRTPSITNFQKDFNSPKGSNTIYFGMKNIKSLTGVNGDKTIKAIEDTAKLINKQYKDFTWMDVLIHLSKSINSTNFKTLCSIGFFRSIKDSISRNKALYEYDIFKILSNSELKWVEENYEKYKWNSLLEMFKSLAPKKKDGGGTFNENRKQIIENELLMIESPPHSLEDDNQWIIEQEIKFLGCPVSFSKIGTCDMMDSNITCKDIIDGVNKKNLRLAANIVSIKDHTIKKKGPSYGKLMSFMVVEDDMCKLDGVVVFPEAREASKYSLFEGNNVMLYGYSDGNGSFLVEKIVEI
jgi:DNA polymerase III alpha subunit